MAVEIFLRVNALPLAAAPEVAIAGLITPSPLDIFPRPTRNTGKPVFN